MTRRNVPPRVDHIPQQQQHQPMENRDDQTDPLENVCDFNIIQFLEEGVPNPQFDEYLDMPDNYMKIDQPMIQDPLRNPMFQHMQQTGRLPDTPPITDAASGSSGSPSGSSEPPYSPDTFNNFGIRVPLMNNGLVLGVQDLPQDLGRRYDNRKFDAMGNQLLSPEAAYMSPPFAVSQQPTPASYIQSVSPDSQTDPQGFVPGKLYNALNVSSDGSISSSDGNSNRKRPRLDPNMDPTRLLNVALGNPNSMSASPDFGCDENAGQPIIKFNRFQEETWGVLFDVQGQQLSQLSVNVVADKGFNFSTNDSCFVNQKKNHFQISVHVEACDPSPPRLVKIDNQLVPVTDFKIAFCGVKAEAPASEVTIRQSHADRKPHPHVPVSFEIVERRMTKVTVPRLHFSETTLNNQRKNLRPNPDQKFFLLVVRLYACFGEHTVLIQAYASEKVIVRATNPGSFEPPETEANWNKSGSVLHTAGPVVIGNDKAQHHAKLTVDGDIFSTGRLIHPSDLRLKENITEKTAREALENLQKLRIVDYFYKPEVAEKWGLTEEQRRRTGVIAQELAEVLPDAVTDIGEFLTVNESRVFYETVLATQELCRLTGDLDMKIDEKVAEISQRLAKYAARKKMLSSMSSNLNDDKSLAASRMSLVSATSTIPASSSKKNKSRKNQSSSSSTAKKPEQNKKLRHSTIAILIAIMSMCLVAMSGLYILDWHNRNFGYQPKYSRTTDKPLVSDPGDAPANLIMSLDQSVPMFQPGAPVVWPVCMSVNCQNYCCANTEIGANEDEDIPLSDDFEVPVPEPANPLRALGPEINITLPQFGMHIDKRYCYEKSCNKRKGIYNLYIPISRWYPNHPIEVQFTVSDSQIVNNCGYISDFDQKQCGAKLPVMDGPFPTASLVFSDLYELSIGEYSQSAYRFRVAHHTEACIENDEGVIGMFEEYNLIFYRQCTTPKDTDVTSAPPEYDGF